MVDQKQLGGGLTQQCADAGGGQTAAAIFGDRLSYATQQPGFVCRVDGVPSSAPCVTTSPGNAYWGLFWSDGVSGQWAYATYGATGLTVPDGGYVAFVWQGQAERALPGVPAVARRAAPTQTPTQTPTASPTTNPTRTPTKTHTRDPGASPTRSSTRSPGRTPTTDSTAGRSPEQTRTADPTGRADEDASSSATGGAEPEGRRRNGRDGGRAGPSGATDGPASSDPSSETVTTGSADAPAGDPTPTAGEPGGDALPTWIPLAAVAVLALAGVLLSLLRRRRADAG